MDIDTLRLFVRITQYRSLAAASAELNLSPAGLSRAIKRLEESLRVPLFDRSGKSLVLNDAGSRLRERAVAIIDLADATAAEFEGAAFKVHCRIAAPAVLQWEWGLRIADALEVAQPGSSLSFRTIYEDEALEALARGDVDFAIVTQTALDHGPMQHLASSFDTLALSVMRMQFAAGGRHPLVREHKGGMAAVFNLAQILECDFVAPTRSMFCGVGRGARSDGWSDDNSPRRIRYWVDDLQQLVQFVSSGKALAYLPKFVIERAGLQAITIGDNNYYCEEHVILVWRRSAASGWQQRMLGQIEQR
ncbi:MAG: LysR family transcriptional regulator [Burkholderiaceae bacterium]|nr:LysR family transcriptional regulator [Burkholderiaceae bacterium]